MSTAAAPVAPPHIHDDEKMLHKLRVSVGGVLAGHQQDPITSTPQKLTVGVASGLIIQQTQRSVRTNPTGLEETLQAGLCLL
jgi:hypothetical protein